MKITVFRIASIYFVCEVLTLILATAFNMRASQEGVDASSLTNPAIAFAFLFWTTGAIKLSLPNYRLYKPVYPIVFYIIFFMWSFFPTIFTEGLTFTETIVNCCMVLTPMIVFLSTHNAMLQSNYEKTEKGLFLFFFICLFVQFVSIFREINFLDLAHIGSGFYLLYLLPLILTMKSRFIKIVCSLIVIFALFLSMKRSGIIALAFALLGYIFIRQYVRRKFNIRSFIGSIVTISIAGALFFILGNSDANRENMFDRFENIEKDNGSGRLEVWEHTYSMIADQDIFHFMVGNGYDTVRRDSHLQLSAHNDFLEVTYDFGLIGLLLYILAFTALIAYVVRMVRAHSQYAPPAAMLCIIYLVQSMISHIVIYYWVNLFMLSFGYMTAKYRLGLYNTEDTTYESQPQQKD